MKKFAECIQRAKLYKIFKVECSLQYLPTALNYHLRFVSLFMFIEIWICINICSLVMNN